jgi:death-on-curing protein
VDGNKRAAFFISDIFLRLNGWKLSVDSNAGFTFIVGSLEDGLCDFDHLLPWIQQHLEKT